MAQKKVALACTVCGSRNYTIDANPNRADRLEVKKFCKYCGKHTLHRETR
ncbi:50S ribosomal protein L33 [Lactiplantibacillus plantarum]|nr:50S ribosomal protein L33 [Lactiplantibacillus plantarum]AVE84401.1 50S ribosomal protein L33 [Lactiplantibacillus plantarum]MCC6117119.1 50S ribosomal protein L33 [Lactiplantibacillus plantarum]MCW6114667.1 50S ribosomal protein L33 [Lactiplantibacillus plantarum]QJP84117.1 50S ribosomal protein L33 [Lactiplantibacillus plantarum]